jgi:hypothetical protein
MRESHEEVEKHIERIKTQVQEMCDKMGSEVRTPSVCRKNEESWHTVKCDATRCRTKTLDIVFCNVDKELRRQMIIRCRNGKNWQKKVQVLVTK